jgi:predicted GTPase
VADGPRPLLPIYLSKVHSNQEELKLVGTLQSLVHADVNVLIEGGHGIGKLQQLY